MTRKKSLSVLDLAFFVLESAERMANIGPLIILKPRPGQLSSHEFADSLMERMKAQPVGAPFDYVYVPPGFARMPHLESVAQINLDDHCFRHTLNAPGTREQLFDFICKIHVKRLDRTRPPWEFYIIDGLQDGAIALYAKVHHGIIDGRSFVEICTRWFSTDPKSTEIRALWQPLRVASSEHKTKSLTVNAIKAMRQILGTSFTLAAVTRFVARQTLKSLGMGQGAPLPFVNTSDAFKSRPSIKRSFAYCVLPLAPLHAFAKAHDATVNDVFLTVLDMALHRYLNEHGGTLGKPLVADMPLAINRGTRISGNQLAILQFPLGAEKSSPAHRLQEIRAQTHEIKDQVKHESVGALVMYTAAIHGIPAIAELLGIKHAPTLANMVISNPFGFDQVCYLDGAEVDMVLPMSVLAPGQSLNITAATYSTHFQIAFLGLARQMPDIQKLAHYTVQAFEELRAAFADIKPVQSTGRTSAPSRTGAPRKAKKT